MASVTLRLGLEKVDFRPPSQVTDDTSVLTLKNLVFEPLLKWQPGGLVRPALFESWEQSSSGREWRFHIRTGAAFHDGEACVASHIVDFIRAILDSRDTFGMRWSYHRYLAQTTITADFDDERTLCVSSPEPIVHILDIFTEFYPSRLDVHGQAVLGTGRYRVSRFDKDRGLATLELVDPQQQEQRGAPLASSPITPHYILASAIPSASARLEGLTASTLDAALNLERLPSSSLPLSLPSPPSTQDPLRWGTSTNTLSVIFYLNCSSGLFASPAARLAANHAVDIAALARDVFHNLAEPATTAVSPFHLGASTDTHAVPIAYDPDEARRLLRSCAEEDVRRPLILRTPTFMPDHAEATARFVAIALRAVGLQVRVEVEPERAAYARQVGLDKRVGDLALFDSSPHSTFRVLDDKISAATRGVWWQGYEDGELERRFAQARTRVEGGEREAAYASCLQRLRENPPWLYLVHPIEAFAAREGWEGLTLDCKGVLNVA